MDDKDTLTAMLGKALDTFEIEDVLTSLNKAILAKGGGGLNADDVRLYIYEAYCTDCGSGQNVEIH